MKKTALIIFLAALAACGAPKLGNIPSEGNDRLASLLVVGEAPQELYLTDYFPALGPVDSTTCSPGITLALTPEDNVYTVATAQDGQRTGWIKFWKGGSALSLALQRGSGKPVRALYTAAATKNGVALRFDTMPGEIVALWQNQLLDGRFVSLADGQTEITIPGEAAGYDRSHLRVFASVGDELFSDVLVPLENGRAIEQTAQLTRFDHHRQILYSLMIDRFKNGNTANDWKLNSPEVLDIVDYQGGDIAGITQKIRDGYFNALGVSTIWISPITQNPYDAWGQYPDPKTKFTGYHGYWPIYITSLDPRFSTPGELRTMLDEAHSHDLNVILDYVANHMHIDSPTLKDNPGWTTPLYLPDGRRNLELWDEQRLTTWFDLHIPTLDMEREEIYQPMTDSALYWVANYDFDGFRHDATKHLPEVYWRTLTSKMRQRYPERSLYQIGETYGSPELIASYVKSGMLDAQFDFNVYDRATWNIASDRGSMEEISREILSSLRTYGYHNLMGYITGNHDRPRYISLAGGSLTFEEDSKAAGWKREITVGDSTVSYDKLAMLEALMMTIPGVPCIYQGDEYGVPGGNDPDNRRMMQFDGLSPGEKQHLATVEKLTHLRRGSMALLYGQYLPLEADKTTLAFARAYMGRTALVAMNNSAEAKTIVLEVPYGLELSGLQPNFGGVSRIEGSKVEVSIAPHSFEILTN